MSPRAAILFYLLSSTLVAQVAVDPVKGLEAWLAGEPAERSELADEGFAGVSLDRKQAARARELLVSDLAARLRSEREPEWRAKEVRVGKHAMRFDFRVFGRARPGKRRLFISMHGGGGAPKETNDRQWRNQIGLYRPKEGVYLAPRAPTDTWNMWHQAHVDALFLRIIEDAVLFEGVDPDRVYLMGYSAGGDGVYQVAPRMADRFAAAAMMAGHPNETDPAGLRNLPFTLHMGGEDSAYKRNEIAATWKKKLAGLRKADRGGYPHEVVIHAGKGHWMEREDAVAVPWMAKFERRRRPERVVWRQDDVVHPRFYWLGMPDGARRPRSTAAARIEGQRVIIEEGTTAPTLTLWLDDDLLDLDRHVVIVREGKPDDVRRVSRTIGTIAETLRLDAAGVWFSRIDVVLD